MWKNFSKNYLLHGHALMEMFTSPVLGPESLKDISLRWYLIISQPVAPTRLSPALPTGQILGFVYPHC